MVLWTDTHHTTRCCYPPANVAQSQRINPLRPAAAASAVARCPESLAVHVTLLAPAMPRILTNVGTFSLTNRGFSVCV